MKLSEISGVWDEGRESSALQPPPVPSGTEPAQSQDQDSSPVLCALRSGVSGWKPLCAPLKAP